MFRKPYPKSSKGQYKKFNENVQTLVYFQVDNGFTPNVLALDDHYRSEYPNLPLNKKKKLSVTVHNLNFSNIKCSYKSKVKKRFLQQIFTVLFDVIRSSKIIVRHYCVVKCKEKCKTSMRYFSKITMSIEWFSTFLIFRPPLLVDVQKCLVPRSFINQKNIFFFFCGQLYK